MNFKELKLTEKRIEVANRLGLNDSNDILSYYPYRYEEYVLSSFKDWIIGSTVTFECELITYPTTFRYGKRSSTRFKVLFEDNELNITIFNRPWINGLKVNEKLILIGKYDGNNKVTALNYYTSGLDKVLGIIPIYSLKDGINQSYLRKLIEYTYDRCKDEIIDYVPSELKKRHHLIDYRDALYNVHFPSDKSSLQLALSRLKYDEFLKFYVCLNILNKDNSLSKKPKEFKIEKINELISLLPYELTKDQSISINEILDDLRSNKIMNRLLQGDVGCGKTAVAMICLYANYLAGYKGALMAPTEILCKQHFNEISSYLKPLGVKVEVIYSNIDDINLIKKRLKDGDIDIIIGTHALIEDDIDIKDLGLVITDEQHRFGVRQRRVLRNKGDDVDFMMMSATPIPRTLASSIYGDMSISTIETMPLNRKGCVTKLINENSVVSILNEIKEELNNGRQIYIIGASIEANPNYSAKDITRLYESLANDLKPYRVGIIHGRMDTELKDSVMLDFNENKIQVLVSTTVVEVGVNVKNATMMIIYDADKFGLSQLHQLRGRVQRGSYMGKCYLLTDSKDPLVKNRLEVLVKSNNGFEISFEDLKQRGPGDILGTRQSGLPTFILGNFINDKKFIETSRTDALEIINNKDDFECSKYYNWALESISKSSID